MQIRARDGRVKREKGERERNDERGTRGEITDMTTARGAWKGGTRESWEIASGVNPICATSGLQRFIH